MAEEINHQKYCTIYVVRHGETSWNVKHILQGQIGPGLNKTGKKQAQLAAQRLKKINFAAVFSSDLARAKQTAAIIAAERELAVTTHQALRERSFGSYEGRHADKLREELKDLLDEYDQLAYEQKFTYQFPKGIEVIESAIARFITYLRQIAVAYQNKNILVVTHGDVMRHFLLHLAFCRENKLSDDGIDNTAHIKILCDGVDFFIKETFGIQCQT